MPLGAFTLLTAAGSAIWNTIFLTIGFFMGSNWTVIEPYTDIFSKVVYAIVALVILWFLLKLVLREKKRRELGLPDPDQKHLEELERENERQDSAEDGTEDAHTRTDDR